ncbi:hypothetical protein V8J82_14120 [Gymnodinialimonas sp. 2305UL16-5]|uniref:hypothetical protein n=1 Tax=Gymnodinialimonas mytili TaxID=3126503 RepID=UPI0030B0AEAB
MSKTDPSRTNTPFRRALVETPFAAHWTATQIDHYIDFTAALDPEGKLNATFGKGGVSYFGGSEKGRVFLCHFNAAPRASEPDLGFADFRYASIENHVDVDGVIARLSEAAEGHATASAKKTWFSLHFALSDTAKIAGFFRAHLVNPVLASFNKAAP